MNNNNDSNGCLVALVPVIIAFIIAAITGSAIILIIGGLIGVYLFCHSDNNTSRSIAPDDKGLIKIRIEEILSVVSQCYNKDTHAFDFELYWHEYTDLWLNPPQVKSFLESELKSVAKGQINYIKNTMLFIEWPEETERRIKNLAPGIVENIPFLAGGGNEQNCPDAVKRFSVMLKDIKYSRKSCTKDMIQSMLFCLKDLNL